MVLAGAPGISRSSWYLVLAGAPGSSRSSWYVAIMFLVSFVVGFENARNEGHITMGDN